MKLLRGREIGTVVGNTSPHEFRFHLKSFSARLGDLVFVQTRVPRPEDKKAKGEDDVIVWGRIVELSRFNPFLPAEAGQELAEEGLKLIDTVLSVSRDHVEGKVLILGASRPEQYERLVPLNYPVGPGIQVQLPPAETVKAILTGNDREDRLEIGHLIGRSEVSVSIKTNAILARHMAILAMTGGGKTVAARRIIRELIHKRYPLLILDPHGDYLGLWLKQEKFKDVAVRIFYPNVVVREDSRGVIGFLIANMTQGLTEPQKEVFFDAVGQAKVDEDGTALLTFINRVKRALTAKKSDDTPKEGDDRTAKQSMGRKSRPLTATVNAVRRALTLVENYFESMQQSNMRLRDQEGLKRFTFDELPDSELEPSEIIKPGQVSILYLGGYDHLTQSSIVALTMMHLFNHRASMSNEIPPFYTVIEEAHNFIPSKGEGQAETPSVEIIKKVMTEGRKFGTGVLLVSQRPSRLDETALSQCNTYLIFRLVNPRDQNVVKRVMENLTEDDARLLPGFGPGQGIISGQAVRFPLVIEVKHDEDLETPELSNEDFLKQVDDWGKSHRGQSAARTDRLLKELNDN